MILTFALTELANGFAPSFAFVVADCFGWALDSDADGIAIHVVSFNYFPLFRSYDIAVGCGKTDAYRETSHVTVNDFDAVEISYLDARLVTPREGV